MPRRYHGILGDFCCSTMIIFSLLGTFLVSNICHQSKTVQIWWHTGAFGQQPYPRHAHQRATAQGGPSTSLLFVHEQ